jgi:two-component system phosphate regulon sensor histidine kinase PhoR
VLLKNEVGHNLPEVNCDGKRIEQVLTNLTANAIKFSPSGGVVTISGRAEDGKVRFCVTDNGAGIPPAALPRVFDKFFQAQLVTETGRKGTGLGLAIVKHIVELHGGEVGVESSVGGGSRFFFTLPQ